MAKAHSRNQRYGYVTMATTEQGQRCIKELNGTELKGRKISVNLVSWRGEGRALVVLGGQSIQGQGKCPFLQ